MRFTNVDGFARGRQVRRHDIRLSPLARAAVFLPGCAHAVQAAGPAVPAVDGRAAARSVQLCTTTEAELRAALGEPTRDGVLRRDRIVSWIIGDGDVVSYLAVLVDARGIVADMVWDVPTEVPWTPANQCAG